MRAIGKRSGCIGKHRFSVLTASVRRHAHDVIVSYWIRAELARHVARFRTNQPHRQIGFDRWLLKPATRRIVIQDVKKLKKQRGGRVGTAQFGHAHPRKIADPHANRIALVIPNTPRIPPTVGRTGFPGNARQVVAVVEVIWANQVG